VAVLSCLPLAFTAILGGGVDWTGTTIPAEAAAVDEDRPALRRC
jgi:hypothetical protein